MRPLKILKDTYCWSIAISYVVLLWLGWYMVGLTFFDRWYHDSLLAHKSRGMIILFLIHFRVLWIISVGAHRAFIDKRSFPRRYRRITFYFLMAVINITGFLISTSAGAGVKIFGFDGVPAVVSIKAPALDFVISTHYYLAYGSAVLILIHAVMQPKPRIFSRFKSR